MITADTALTDFLARQLTEFGGKVEADGGVWILFGVSADDEAANQLARSVLADATFPYDSGLTEDDRWMLYYVDTAARPTAIHWLHDVQRRVAGEIRQPSPAQRHQIEELVTSPMPHRVAQSLAEQHGRGELSAGCISDRVVIRALLDRLHAREPLFYSALQLVLGHHLIDLTCLLERLIPEDVELANETVRGSLSRDPFLRTRQTAAAEIRNAFVRFFVINSLDQQKNTAIDNPYAAYLELVCRGEDVTVTVDGSTATTPRAQFVRAIRSIRRNLYRGGDFERFDTQMPWVDNDIALAFRFIKQRLEIHRELAPLDGLFMLERAVAP